MQFRLFSSVSSYVLKAMLLASCALSVFGCNGVGDKDTLWARIDDEKVYKEDYLLLLKNHGSFHFTKEQILYDSLYSKAAMTAKAIQEFPELEKEWQVYFKDMEPRVLTMIYQRFYAMECMMQPESELRSFYKDHKDLFSQDSVGEFELVRGDVAKKYYLKKHAKEYEEFVAKIKSETQKENDSLALQNQFLNQEQLRIRAELSKDIREKYKITISTLPAVDPKEFYQRHGDLFMTVSGYELYQVQGSDSAALSALFAEGASLEQFKVSALSLNKGSVTQKDSGLVGSVKKDFALPYGIGVVEGLGDELEGKDAGFITRTLRGQDGLFHRFFLVKQVPSVQKDYDRVESGVKAGILSGTYYDYDSSAVLIYKDGKPLLTEAELLGFNDRITKVKLSLKNHDRIVDMIAENYAYAEAAKSLKLDHSWEYRAIVRDLRWNFFSDSFVEMKRSGRKLSDDELRAFYDRVGSPIGRNLDFESAKDDIRLVMSTPENFYRREYLYGYKVIYVGKTYEESIPLIYAKRKKELDLHFRNRLRLESYKNSSVHLYENGVSEYVPCLAVDCLLPKADSLYKAGERTSAFYDYRRLAFVFAENDTLFERVAYEMAQLQAENEEFPDAEAEYYAFYRMWPNSKNAEKAMFSRGFLLNENLGWNEPALEVLEEFIKTYPDSDLRESAEWLIRNIKTDGKLAEDLLKKISSEE